MGNYLVRVTGITLTDIKNKDVFGTTSSILFFCATMALLFAIIILFVTGATYDCYSHALYGKKPTGSVPDGSKQFYEPIKEDENVPRDSANKASTSQ